MRSLIIGISFLGKPRDRARKVSRFILVAHAIRQRTDILVEHAAWDIVEIWVLLTSSIPFSESLLLTSLLRYMIHIVIQ